MKIIRNTTAYNIAIEAGKGVTEKVEAFDEKGKPIIDKETGLPKEKFVVNKDKVKTWFTIKNKKGATAIKRIVLAIEDAFTDNNGNFEMPSFNKVRIDEEAGYIELCPTDGSIDNTVIIKKSKES